MTSNLLALVAAACLLAPRPSAADPADQAGGAGWSGPAAVASLQQLDRIPFPRHIVAPVCPAELGAVKDRVEVSFLIDEAGGVGHVEARTGAYPALRACAIEAISQWRFDPPTRGGRRTQAAASQTFVFAPRDPASTQTEIALPTAPAAPAAAEGDGAAPPPRSRLGAFFYSLLPKAFQRQPVVHLAVVTETTPEGRDRPGPNPTRPTYYLSQAIAYPDQAEGDPLPESVVLPELGRALARRHFLPAGPGRPATLMIVFSWGSTNELKRPADRDAEIDVLGRFFERETFFARARLVGGNAFVQQVIAAVNQHDLNTGGPPPLQLLADRDPLNRQLLEEARADCYFVVVSAYDAGAMAHGQRRLLWQTKITTNSEDLAMRETLPALIRAGSPYLGRDMAGPQVLATELGAEASPSAPSPLATDR